MELLLGAGASRDRRLKWGGHDAWTHLVTLDQSAAHAPDVVHDLEQLPYPFASDSMDEIHAYEVLEHIGQQGDWRTFFAQFSELWRILTPGGFLAGTCPSYQSAWAWGDPSHRRVITAGTLVFLNQAEYARQIGVTAMSDFRPWYHADFEPAHIEETSESLTFILQAIKPARLVSP
jgi:SAM-dependent methyltransferase